MKNVRLPASKEKNNNSMLLSAQVQMMMARLLLSQF